MLNFIGKRKKKKEEKKREREKSLPNLALKCQVLFLKKCKKCGSKQEISNLENCATRKNKKKTFEQSLKKKLSFFSKEKEKEKCLSFWVLVRFELNIFLYLLFFSQLVLFFSYDSLTRILIDAQTLFSFSFSYAILVVETQTQT